VHELAIVALTPNGLQLGQRLARSLGHGEVISGQGAARQALQMLFETGRPIVAIMALGIVVRVLGPLTRDKETDPAVVVVDEAGRFAISVLGGHWAGANELAKQVAEALGAVPVLTTASDALGLPPIDLIGRAWGWKIEGRENLTKVAAALVRGEAIAVYQEVGRQDWWQEFGDWPSSFQKVKTWPQGRWGGLLAITDQWIPPDRPWPVVMYRPPTLVLGVGCRRGVPCAEIEATFANLFQTRGFAPLSLGVVATAALKAEEPGLKEFAASHGVPLQTYSLEQLGAVADLPTPSKKVRAKIGIAGVAEPAAMLAAGTNRLLISKYVARRVTMALARRDEP
jgi:cobalt-precorrin 5A hydrolase